MSAERPSSNWPPVGDILEDPAEYMRARRILGGILIGRYPKVSRPVLEDTISGAVGDYLTHMDIVLNAIPWMLEVASRDLARQAKMPELMNIESTKATHIQDEAAELSLRRVLEETRSEPPEVVREQLYEGVMGILSVRQGTDLEGLGSILRTAIVEDKPFETIARELDISLNTIYMKVSRARVKIEKKAFSKVGLVRLSKLPDYKELMYKRYRRYLNPMVFLGNPYAFEEDIRVVRNMSKEGLPINELEAEPEESGLNALELGGEDSL